MFSHFIYFIIALIILTLYQPSSTPALGPYESFLGLICLSILFIVYTRNRFHRLAQRVGSENRLRLDHRFGLLVTRHLILALIAFGIAIWALELPSHLAQVTLFQMMPTLADLMFLILFVGYMTLVWVFAYDAQRVIYQSDLSRKDYVYSNVALSVPVLLPWLVLFGLSDVIHLLPSELPKRILDSSVGQTLYFLIFLVVAAIFAPLLIQRFWRCRPLEKGFFRNRIEALCQRTGVRYADIVYWPIFGGRMITAGVMGLVGRFRYILVTDALLQLLSPQEIDQVIAHEIGHVKRRHLPLYLLLFVGFMLISYAAYPLSVATTIFSKTILGVILSLKINPVNFIYSLYALFLVLGIVLYFRFIFGFFIRNFERQADLFVFRLFPDAHALIATFNKIVDASGQPAEKPNWHHFSIRERIDYLIRCEQSPAWIDRHDRKVRNSIIAYLIGFSIMAVAVFQLNQMVLNQSNRQFTLTAIENYLLDKEPKTEEDALLYGLIGTIYLERNNLDAAIAHYENAIALNSNDPDILNNLAWLLATSRDSEAYDPERALILAQRAIGLKSAPHIWDTLAEALFVNGRIEEAIAAERQALEMNPEDRKIYEEQLDKFRKALQNLK